jgi:hypothetical protein
MNRDQVLHHLRETRDAIDQMISDIEADATYEYGSFWVDMQHTYHHLNTAWNSRDASAAEVERSSDAQFNQWSALPTDLPMMRVGDTA